MNAPFGPSVPPPPPEIERELENPSANGDTRLPTEEDAR